MAEELHRCSEGTHRSRARHIHVERQTSNTSDRVAGSSLWNANKEQWQLFSNVNKECSSLQAIAHKIGQSDKAHDIEVREVDLTSLESVRRFAGAFNKEDRRLDVLICNAGIMAPPERQQTVDGLEMQFQVRHL